MSAEEKPSRILELRIVPVDGRDDAVRIMREIGVDEGGIRIMAPKAIGRVIHLENLITPAALILKEQMLSLGGDVAIHRSAINSRIEHTDALLMGNMSQIGKLIPKLRQQSFGLSDVADRIEAILNGKAERRPFIIETDGRTMNLSRKTHIMGILNVTPDSFSDGGQYDDRERALGRAMEMEEEGADIIDIGGESTRPGATPLSTDEEMKRVVPVIRAVKRSCSVPLSIDTTRAEVAKAALDEGASIVNDISGFGFDRAMPELVAERRVPVILMHIRGTPQTMQDNPEYTDLFGDILSYFSRRIDLAGKDGVGEEQIIIDPGIGFGKTVEHNYSILKHLRRFSILKRPIMVGPSRKSFIGKILDLPPSERLEGTAAAVTAAILNGAHIVRVHDVREMVRIARICDVLKAAE